MLFTSSTTNGTDYTTVLPTHLKLSSSKIYKVIFVRATIPLKFLNISAALGNNTFTARISSTDAWRTATIEDGIYNGSTFITEWHRLMRLLTRTHSEAFVTYTSEADLDTYVYKIELTEMVASDRLLLHIDGGCEVTLPADLAAVLGFTTLVHDTDGEFVGEETPAFDRGITQILVGIEGVSGQIVNGIGTNVIHATGIIAPFSYDMQSYGNERQIFWMTGHVIDRIRIQLFDQDMNKLPDIDGRVTVEFEIIQ